MIRAISLLDQNDREVFATNFARFNINFSLLTSSILRSKTSLPNTIEHIDMGHYKLVFYLTPEFTLCLLADRINEEKEINKFIDTVSDNLRSIVDGDITSQSIRDSEREIAEMLETNIRNIPVKTTFAGSGGVGKTTMVKLLAKDEQVLEYNPTLLADVEQLRTQIGSFQVSLFTLAGQPQYRKTWDVVGEATDIVVLVLDSSETNLSETKNEVLPQVRDLMPYSRLVAIANKQDLPGVLSPGVIQEELGIPTYGMVAIREDAKERLINILEHMITRTP